MNTCAQKLRYIAIASALSLGVLGMQHAQAQNIAIVNGEPIAKTRMDTMLENFKKEAAQQGQPLPPDLEKNVREHLIQSTVNTQQAKRLKLHLTPEYAEKLADARAAILTQMLFEHYKESRPITDAAARQEYERIVKETSANAQQEYRARHILVKTKKHAQQLLAQLQSGADFSELAKKHSEDPGSAQQGGDLNWSVANNYVPAFAKALSTLKKGAITKKPIKTEFGYHLIKLDDARTTQPPAFDLVKSQIKQQMQQKTIGEDFKQYLQQLRKAARIQ